MKNKITTGFLFSTPTFLSGTGSILNLFGDYYEYNNSENPDEVAIYSDFENIGEDIEIAIKEYSAKKDNLIACK